ncbi:hypothetical protein TcasGA2_TC015697 [Tribolium castaneum]|uniref:Uncharacterized protein n=1 Tax=Tribolium castaneum TaxID=7070 RepID=D2A6H2_TRICA|nr:hypothetical protein TcasGA2_TC015697 [Tribolium castaneum]
MSRCRRYRGIDASIPDFSQYIGTYCGYRPDTWSDIDTFLAPVFGNFPILNYASITEKLLELAKNVKHHYNRLKKLCVIGSRRYLTAKRESKRTRTKRLFHHKEQINYRNAFFGEKFWGFGDDDERNHDESDDDGVSGTTKRPLVPLHYLFGLAHINLTIATAACATLSWTVGFFVGVGQDSSGCEKGGSRGGVKRWVRVRSGRGPGAVIAVADTTPTQQHTQASLSEPF